MNYLFPNFLKDINEFNQAQEYWVQLCREVLESNHQLDKWILGAEDPQMDTSDFYSWGLVGGFNDEKTKGFSVDQQDPKQCTKWEMIAYTIESDKFSDTQPIVYLQFTCNLSEKSSEIFRTLLTR